MVEKLLNRFGRDKDARTWCNSLDETMCKDNVDEERVQGLRKVVADELGEE